MTKNIVKNVYLEEVYKNEESFEIPNQPTFKKISETSIPKPGLLNKYNLVIPDGAERFMKMAEKKLEHDMFIEKQFMSGEISKIRIGQVFAFLIAIIILSFGTYLTVNGKEEVGGILFGVTLVSLVTVFIRGRLRIDNLKSK